MPDLRGLVDAARSGGLRPADETARGPEGHKRQVFNETVQSILSDMCTRSHREEASLLRRAPVQPAAVAPCPHQ